MMITEALVKKKKEFINITQCAYIWYWSKNHVRAFHHSGSTIKMSEVGLT